MSGWNPTTVGELVSSKALEFGDGYRTKRSEHGQPGFRIIRVADVAENVISFEGPDFVSGQFGQAIGAKAGQAGDILLTTKGTVGRVAVMPEVGEPVVYSPQLCYFRVKEPDVIDPRFMRFWFSSPEFWNQAADRMNNTDMAAYINMADIRSLKLSLPSVDVQQAIAEVLGALDDKIAANTKLAAAAEDLAVALLSSFKPTVHLDDIVGYHKNSTNPELLNDSIVAQFSLPAFDSGQLPDESSPLDIKSSKFLIERPSVLVSKLNPRFPRLWNVSQVPSIPALASTEFLVLEPLHSSTTVLWAILSQPGFSAALESKVAGTSGSHQRVKPGDLLATLVLDPRAVPADIQDRVTSTGLVAADTRLQNANLAATRDALLPQLMSGKLRVKDAETLVSAAV